MPYVLKSIEQFTKGTISTAEGLAVNGETDKALSEFSKLLDIIEDVRGKMDPKNETIC